MTLGYRGLRFAHFFVWEGLLGAWRLHHWVANVHWVELRERGLLTYHLFCLWDKMTRIG